VEARAAARASARARILDAAVKLVAREGINDVRIARIAMEAGVSASLLHYHFASRDALLAEALEHSYELAGTIRIGPDDEPAPAAARLQHMIDQCLPAAARRLAAVGRAVAARRAPPRAAPDRRAPVRAHARLVR
jgi:AcrR family transcriptional regulator